MPTDIAAPFSVNSIRFDASGLVAVVSQDIRSKEVLMLAYANRQAIELTLSTKKAHYFSRSRQELWQKGESSGHTQAVQSVRLDCDGDAVLYLVEQSGAACHTGASSCFHNHLFDGPTTESTHGLGMLNQIYDIIGERIRENNQNSYVAKLHTEGLDRILKKIGEEAGEVIIAAKNKSKPELTLEVADLIFHTLITMNEIGVQPEDIGKELANRHAKKKQG